MTAWSPSHFFTPDYAQPKPAPAPSQEHIPADKVLAYLKLQDDMRTGLSNIVHNSWKYHLSADGMLQRIAAYIDIWFAAHGRVPKGPRQFRRPAEQTNDELRQVLKMIADARSRGKSAVSAFVLIRAHLMDAGLVEKIKPPIRR